MISRSSDWIEKKLSASEIAVGTFGSAAPGSLILPRTNHETAALIGQTDDGPAAIILSGKHRFQYFPSGGNSAWKGLIIPDARVEVDETSIFDPAPQGSILGAIIRRDTLLSIEASSSQVFGASTAVALQMGLRSAGDYSAGFLKWNVVVGEGSRKRILLSVDLSDPDNK